MARAGPPEGGCRRARPSALAGGPRPAAARRFHTPADRPLLAARSCALLWCASTAAELQLSVNRVFETLNAAVTKHQGTEKEFQGDAVLACREGDFSRAQARG